LSCPFPVLKNLDEAGQTINQLKVSVIILPAISSTNLVDQLQVISLLSTRVHYSMRFMKMQ